MPYQEELSCAISLRLLTAIVISMQKTNKFSAADLKANNAPGSDPKNKELYLADDEFKAIFGCTQDEFAKQPNWKREAAKKKSGLF